MVIGFPAEEEMGEAKRKAFLHLVKGGGTHHHMGPLFLKGRSHKGRKGNGPLPRNGLFMGLLPEGGDFFHPLLAHMVQNAFRHHAAFVMDRGTG